MLSLNCLLYLFCCAAAYVFSLCYVGWYGEYLLWAVIILPPLFTLLSLPAMHALRIACITPKTVNRGNKTELEIKFRCKSLLPVRSCHFNLKIKNIYTGNEYTQAMRYGLISDSSSTINLPTKQSGMLLCSIENIKIYSYLGLVHFGYKYPVQCSCIVMPRLLEPSEMDSIVAMPPTSYIFKPKPGGGYSEEHELRQYRPGDSMNSIHWKLSSKMDDIIVREPMEPVDNGTAVLLDTCDEADLSHLFWLSLRLCAENIKHDIHYADGFTTVENETDAVRAMRLILSCPRHSCGTLSGNYSRIFTVQNGEVHWQ
jgi:hypothetical protein